MTSKFRIGVDGGGTTTRAVILDDALRVLGRGQAGSSNHYSVGAGRAIENVVIAIEDSLAAASLDLSDAVSCGLGLAGACTATEQRTLTDALAPFAKGLEIVVDEDAAAAQAGAFGGEPGAICIAGTGANCFGTNAQGERARADGLGPLLGDRGSGYWIGEAALRAVCRAHDGAAHDGAAPCPALSEGVMRHYNTASVDELVQLVYRPEFTKDRVAALVPVVLQSQVDEAAQQILQAAGEELAATAGAVLRRLNLNRVAVSGGVLARETPVRSSLEKALRRQFPDIQVLEPLHDAAIGAALLVRNS
ncbi:MAG TPA: BadF/BadG/BcrA/BcrD ATPase family protein [Abditibacteriaceae bacterium]|jgi:N-acetylglucosamine kinase-like BadF-type ATPase